MNQVIAENIPNNRNKTQAFMFCKFIYIYKKINEYSQTDQHGKRNYVARYKVFRNVPVDYFHVEI